MYLISPYFAEMVFRNFKLNCKKLIYLRVLEINYNIKLPDIVILKPPL